MFLFLFIFSEARINIYYNKKLPSMSFTENMIDNQIVHGFFKPIGNINCKYSVSIVGSDTGIHHFYTEQLENTEMNYSFNISEPSDFVITFKPTVIDSTRDFVPGKIGYSMVSQVDTFKKEVAKDAKVEPALQTLTWLEELLIQVIRQTERRHKQLNALTEQYNKSIRFMSGFSLLTLSVVIAFNFYQVYSMKQFFKKKKMI